jgi:ABC-type Na+ transport system ATPase subunit NatA
MSETTPGICVDPEEMRRRLGTLDPQQVAVWRDMTPARKLQLVCQMWHLARKIAWSTELTEAELAPRVWKRFHGSDARYVPANQS